MKHTILILAATLALISNAYTQTPTPVDVDIQVFASGFSDPVGIYNTGIPGDERLFILDKDIAEIRILNSAGTITGTFLDMGPAGLVSTGGERGLLGLAFDPDYAINGHFFVNYTDTGGDTQIRRYTVTGDPDVADPLSALDILNVPQDFGNHNGGNIAFGPDSYLYIGMGDGGSGNDPNNRAQNPNSLLGKMLRIDVSNAAPGDPYDIPPTNPFVTAADTLHEIWNMGLRNPWKFSFDPANGDLYIGDVGQWDYEEIDYQAAGSLGGENYGWRCREGFNPNPNIAACTVVDAVDPVYEHTHGGDGFCSINGGVVYRGSEYPSLEGLYLYNDYCNGRIRALENDGGVWTSTVVRNVPTNFMTAFGYDIHGEVYVCQISSGTVFKLIETCGDWAPTISDNGDGSMIASAGTNYWWYENDVLIPGANSQTYTPACVGAVSINNYYAVVENPVSGCSRATNSLQWAVVSGIAGCTNPDADNYNPDATVDDGTCIIPPNLCATDVNQDGIINVADLLAVLADFGNFCP